jgi:aspartate-semialdehyde dehydrogenase
VSVKKLPVAVIGATGIAGQQVLAALDGHPYFEVAVLGASERSAGKSFEEAITEPGSGLRRWYATEASPSARTLALPVGDARRLDLDGVALVFAAVESEAARELEPLYAAKAPTISTARAHRTEPDVPLVIPGVNLDHLELLAEQRKRRKWGGFLVTLPNCTATGLAITLKALDERFGVEALVVTTMQGISGAGRDLPALDIVENIIPYIAREEERVEIETRKILGRLNGAKVIDHRLRVSATCTRAGVLAGHTEAVSVALSEPASNAQVAAAFEAFGTDFTSLRLPSSPQRMITVHHDPNRPQPRLDRDADGGMTTSVGRIRPDPVMRYGVRYVLVTHNARMGAGKGAVLTAEYLRHAGYLD